MTARARPGKPPACTVYYYSYSSIISIHDRTWGEQVVKDVVVSAGRAAAGGKERERERDVNVEEEHACTHAV